MDSETKAQLLERFREYLDQQPEVVPTETGKPERRTDLYALFTELVALKTEVRLESRQFKTVLEDFRAVFAALQTTQTQLSQELDRVLKPVLLDLVELRDRFEAGLRVLQNYRPTFWVRLLGRRRRERDLLQAMAQGQDITLRRLDQILNAQHVFALDAEGQPLDPHTMRAAELDHRPDLANGIVTEELRKGYLWSGELLRLAEVKVNRRPEPATPPNLESHQPPPAE